MCSVALTLGLHEQTTTCKKRYSEFQALALKRNILDYDYWVETSETTSQYTAYSTSVATLIAAFRFLAMAIICLLMTNECSCNIAALLPLTLQPQII